MLSVDQIVLPLRLHDDEKQHDEAADEKHHAAEEHVEQVLREEDNDEGEEDAAQDERDRVQDRHVVWVVALQAIENCLEARVEILVNLGLVLDATYRLNLSLFVLALESVRDFRLVVLILVELVLTELDRFELCFCLATLQVFNDSLIIGVRRLSRLLLLVRR